MDDVFGSSNLLSLLSRDHNVFDSTVHPTSPTIYSLIASHNLPLPAERSCICSINIWLAFGTRWLRAFLGKGLESL